MRDFKNIDRLFQENLKDYEVFPPTKTWNAIDKRLASNPKKNRLPFWVKISSVAALLVLFFSVGTIYFIPQNNFTKNFLPKKSNNLETPDEKDTLNLRPISWQIGFLKKKRNKVLIKLSTSYQV